MKQIAANITCIMAFYMVQAQIVIPNTVPTHLTDVLSQSNYNSINRYNGLITPQLTSNTAVAVSLKDVIGHQRNELNSISWSLLGQLYSIQNFINGTGFSSSLGYNSYGYIQEKYPLIHPNPNEILRNKIVRLRYYKKLMTERQNVSDYLNSWNPIPEGKRILLILTSLENVINITLENETY